MYQYLIPGMQGDPASFVANTTLTLGSLDKPLDAVTQVLVDYSAIIPAISSIEGFSFRVKPGGEPQLWITDGQTGTAPSLAFTVSGGIAGQAYELVINTKLDTGDIRSDVLTINVMGDTCGCATFAPMYRLPDVVSGDGSVVVNVAPRFFISATTPVGARVLDRWYNSITGSIYDFVTNGLASWWEESTIGGGGGYGANIVKMNPIVPDGSTTQFTLTATDGTLVDILGTNTLLVSVDGVWQEPETQYGAAVDQIVFAQAPFSDSIIFMLWLSPPPSTPPPSGL
jgi:hypothetical protein